MVVLNFSISISKLMGLEFTWTKTKIHGLGNLLEEPVLQVQTRGIGLESQSLQLVLLYAILDFIVPWGVASPVLCW